MVLTLTAETEEEEDTKKYQSSPNDRFWDVWLTFPNITSSYQCPDFFSPNSIMKHSSNFFIKLDNRTLVNF